MFGITNTTLLQFNPFLNCTALVPSGKHYEHHAT